MECEPEREVLFTGRDIGVRTQQVPNGETVTPAAGWTKLLVLAGISTTVGCSLPVGYSIGVVNTPAFIIKAFCNESASAHYGVRLGVASLDTLWACVVSIFLVGGAIGSLGGGRMADKFGRRGGLGIALAFAAVAAILFVGSRPLDSIELLLVGRLLIGLASGAITSIMPMYLMELAPARLKGATGALCPLGITAGVLAGQIMSMHNILGNEEYWPQCLAFYFLPLLLCIGVLPILPESPKYLFIIKKQPHIALKQLQRIRDVKTEDLLQNEIQELRVEENDNKTGGEDWNLKKVLTTRSVLLPLLLTCSLQSGQQFSGINAVFYYSSEMFQRAGLSRRGGELATIGAGVCNFGMSIVSLWLLVRFPRRAVLLFSLASVIVSLMVIGTATSLIDMVPWMAYLSIGGVLSFVVCYGIGLGPVPYFVGGELFEVGPRPAAMALGSGANWAANFAIGFAFPAMQRTMGPRCFFIFAAVTAALALFVQIYMPETKGREPSEVAQLVSNGFASRPLHSNNTNRTTIIATVEEGITEKTAL